MNAVEGKIYMSIQPITQSSQINQKTLVSVSKGPQKDNSADPEFKHLHGYNKASDKVKAGVFLTTLTGVAIGTAAMFKYKKMPLKNLKDFFNGLVHVKYVKEKYEIEKLVGVLAVGSVGGGLIGGAIFDKKENMKAKYRESVIQLVGNIFTPLLCVSSINRLYDAKLNSKVLNSMKFLKTKKQQSIPGVIVSIGCLIGAIFAGNKVGNLINEKAFNVKDNRKLKLSDMAPHIDDACLVASLVASPDSEYGAYLARIIPAALMIAGLSVGTAQEKPERLNPNPIQQPKPGAEPTKIAEA